LKRTLAEGVAVLVSSTEIK
jgi:MFS family permease